MRRGLKASLFLAVGLLLAVNALAGVAGAAPASADRDLTVTFTVLPTLTLTLSESEVVLGNVAPGVHTFMNSLITTVYSNTAWSLTAVAAGNFSTGGGSPSEIPIGQLQTRTGGGGWISFATTNVDLLTGQAKGGNRQNTWDYELTVEWNDDPGTYSTGITYTATGS